MTTLTACPQCGNESRVLLHTHDYNRRLSSDVFTYYQCNHCELIFLAPIPSNLGDYYPSSYYQGFPSLESLATQGKLQQYKIDLVKQFKQAGSLLEIGPGRGDFAFLAKRAGFDVNVIEIDEACCQYLRDVVQVNVIHSADTMLALQELGQFDIIVLWQVIEHLADPWSVLDALSQNIAPGGLLIIAAPNPEAIQFKLFRHRWTHLDAPRHLELIPASLLVERLEKRGWQTVLLTTTDAGSLGWNAFGWHYSLRNFFSNRILQFSMRVLARIVRELVRPIERAGLRGSTYTLIMRGKSP